MAPCSISRALDSTAIAFQFQLSHFVVVYSLLLAVWSPLSSVNMCWGVCWDWRGEWCDEIEVSSRLYLDCCQKFYIVHLYR